MRLTASILPLLLATALAFWMPLCLCNGVPRMGAGVGSCCQAPEEERGCCQSGGDSKPCNHEGTCPCTERDVYTGGGGETHVPPPSMVVFVLTWPAPVGVGAVSQVRGPSSPSWAAPPRPPTSLLRQHCALIV